MKRNLELMVVLQAVGVIAILGQIFRAAAAGIERKRQTKAPGPGRADRWLYGTGTSFHIEGWITVRPLPCPVVL